MYLGDWSTHIQPIITSQQHRTEFPNLPSSIEAPQKHIQEIKRLEPFRLPQRVDKRYLVITPARHRTLPAAIPKPLHRPSASSTRAHRLINIEPRDLVPSIANPS
jgi:hypothetical protein